ncbi:hypothetical protein AAZV13_20G029000 [Glycine max]
MPIVTEDMDSAFQTAGANPGLEVWCIENQRLVSVSNSSHGKLYTGSAYLVFNYDIHYWLGNEAKKILLPLLGGQILRRYSLDK